MADPREPYETPPVPTPDGRPEPPIEEPDPDRLPDETPNPTRTRTIRRPMPDGSYRR